MSGPVGGPTQGRGRRFRLGPVIFGAFLLVPVIELAIAIQVGRWIGLWPTLGLLLIEALVGAWIVRREGRQAWQALNAAFAGGRAPGRELTDAALILVGGTLLLTPGFLTDVLGFVLVIPVTRRAVRRLLAATVRWRVGRLGAWQRPGGSEVIRGDVVDPPAGEERE